MADVISLVVSYVSFLTFAFVSGPFLSCMSVSAASQVSLALFPLYVSLFLLCPRFLFLCFCYPSPPSVALLKMGHTIEDASWLLLGSQPLLVLLSVPVFCSLCLASTQPCIKYGVWQSYQCRNEFRSMTFVWWRHPIWLQNIAPSFSMWLFDKHWDWILPIHGMLATYLHIWTTTSFQTAIAAPSDIWPYPEMCTMGIFIWY